MLVFQNCDKTPEIIKLQGGKIDFGSWFQYVQSGIGWLLYLCQGRILGRELILCKAHLLLDSQETE